MSHSNFLTIYIKLLNILNLRQYFFFLNFESKKDWKWQNFKVIENNSTLEDVTFFIKWNGRKKKEKEEILSYEENFQNNFLETTNLRLDFFNESFAETVRFYN